jgi:SAM-dependent methyltransferase
MCSAHDEMHPVRQGENFGAEYAAAYDTLYRDKDYAAECDLIECVFRAYAGGPVRRVLDLGCGTGGHAAPLAARGYQVVGVDRSEAMLAQAHSRGSSARFQQADILGLDLGETFDAVVMMFAVLGYQVTNADVLGALATVRRHLQPGGVFVADAWYGPAVLRQRPTDRVKVQDTPDGQLIRAASGELDVRQHLCSVRYHIWRIDHAQRVSETTEEHRMRYFFPLELEALAQQSGLDVLRLGQFPEFDREPDEHAWNVMLVARAR